MKKFFTLTLILVMIFSFSACKKNNEQPNEPETGNNIPTEETIATIIDEQSKTSACASPYVAMSQQYMKQVNQLWYQIFQVVKENCTTDWNGTTPQEDVMEHLLRSRRGNK